MGWTTRLEDVDLSALPLVGGKCASLGELARAGFAVPPGFCVTTRAYADFVERAGLGTVIREALAGLDVEDGEALARAGEGIRTAFESAPVPAEIADAVRAGLAVLGDGPVAVRSSATAEDLPEASFAGQQDTYLNVVGADAVIDAVRRCWASLWTDRAIAYRTRNGIDHAQVRLACVVQRLIAADAAGVLFTANPVSGRRTEVVLDASPGLGEAIVAGLVTPDHYVIRKGIAGREPAIRERQIAEKAVAIEPATGGGIVRRELAGDERYRPVLSDDEVLALARLGAAVESHYGSPQDVEWARADGEIYVLQSRPITSLFPLPVADPSGPLRVFISVSAAQGLLDPLTPLGLSLFQTALPLGLGAVQGKTWQDSPLVGVAGRLYVDLTGVLRTELGRRVIPFALSQIDPVAKGALEVVLPDPRLAPTPNTGRALLLRGLPKTLRALWPAPRRLVEYLRNPSRFGERLKVQIQPELRRLASDLEAPGKLPERIGRIRPTLRRFGRVFAPEFVPTVVAGVGSSNLLRRLAICWRLDLADVMALRQGVPHNPTTQMDLDLWALSQRIAADPDATARLRATSPEELAAEYRAGSLPPIVQGAFAHFLDVYGHRTIREIDLGVARWSEDPTYLFGVIRGYLEHGAEGTPPDEHFARLAAEAERARARLIQAARRRMLGRQKARIVGFLADRVRGLLGYREAPKFYAVWLFSRLRAFLAGIGAELAANGEIAAADDIFFLTIPELDERARTGRLAPNVREVVAARRATYEKESGRMRLPRVLTSEGDAIYARPRPAGETGLSGAGVSPGVTRGRARIVRDPVGARLSRGEILVAPSTDPAWTPLFLTAGGLVMEAGGMMSHGAVVAREYGIPAVVGVPDATHRLKDGQEIVVDGTAGTVEVGSQA